MSSESYVGLGILFLPAIVPLAVAAAGIAATGAVMYGGAKLAQSAYDAHKKKLIEQYGAESEHLAALDRAVDEIVSARAFLASAIRQRIEREREDAINATAFGKLTLSAMEGLDVGDAVSVSSAANKAETLQVEGEIDFSDLFEADSALGDAVSPTVKEYLEEAKRRVSGLVAFTAKERGAQERLLERCDMLAESSLSVQDAQNAIRDQVEEICMQLMEGDAELRRETFLNYIALCSLIGEKPRELSFEAMADTTRAMGETYVERQLQESILDTVNESLKKVGLENAGAVTFAEEEGYLVVDEDDRTCGIFMRKSDDDGSFLFTTVSAEDPLQVGKGEKKRILASARRLCEKKRKLFVEMLPEAGIGVDIGFEYDPPTLDCIRRMPRFVDHARKQGGLSSEVRESTVDEKRQEM